MNASFFYLANGLRLVLVKNDAAPFVVLKIAARAGTFYGTNRWYALLASSMLERGTKNYTRKELAEFCDAHAIVFNVGAVGPFFACYRGKALTRFIPKLLEVSHECLANPVFPEEELKILKRQERAEFRDRVLDPAIRAKREMLRMLYASPHPLSVPSVEESLANLGNVTREVLVRFWEDFYGPHPHDIDIVLAGDMDEDDTQRQIYDMFGGLRRVSQKAAPYEPAAFQEYVIGGGYEERVVFLPGKASAVVCAGRALPVSVRHPDYAALKAGVMILGHDMQSRLFAHVRERLGLSYHVHATLDGMEAGNGYVEIQAHTNPENVRKARDAIFHVLDELIVHGVTEEELADAKAVYRGRRVLAASSYDGIAKEVVQGIVAGIPNFAEWLEARMAALSVDDVNGAIRRHILPQEMKVVFAGTVGGLVNK